MLRQGSFLEEALALMIYIVPNCLGKLTVDNLRCADDAKRYQGKHASTGERTCKNNENQKPAAQPRRTQVKGSWLRGGQPEFHCHGWRTCSNQVVSLRFTAAGKIASVRFNKEFCSFL